MDDPLVLFGLYGAGGFAREVMPFAAHAGSDPMRCVFLEGQPANERVNGWPVLSEDEFFRAPAPARRFNVAIADSRARERLATTCIERGAQARTLRSPLSLADDSSVLGEGAILCPFTTITANARIGRFFHLNLYAYVAHDCVIGDFVTFAPNVHCNGNVHIGDHAYIGTGAILKQGSAERPLRIGQGAIVGMGAVVTRDVPPYTTVVGNPARVHPTKAG
jgi:sugar O-acyltransferase (sialic acid O-acetyltransferase NeuD family)